MLLTASHFDVARWNKIKTNSDRWWAGTLDRPLVQIRLRNAPSPRKPAKLPFYSFQSFYDPAISADEIIDSCDYELSKTRYMGDAFPHALVNFGPGVIAAFLGADLENGNETVWFHPSRKLEIGELVFQYDANNIWYNRLKNIIAAATRRWNGAVQVGMTDLGGNLDILSVFRPHEGLLLDLYDHPKIVKELTWQAHELWWRYFDELNAVLQPTNPGYSAWSPMFSSKPYYILQCDFCYMIGPSMFDEFVKPELAASCDRLPNAFYHLDGKGQLPHLDSLLSIRSLKGIQWVPGTGALGLQHWPEIYKKIHASGKLIQLYNVYDGLEALESIVDQVGTAKGMIFLIELDISQETDAIRFMKKIHHPEC
jgi:5-methyltetrahydrofolate--homocysteine methyltransferase